MGGWGVGRVREGSGEGVFPVFVYVGVYTQTLVQNHNHYNTARAIYSVAQEREIEGVSADDG